MKKLAWTFAAMGILLIFVVLDWFPIIKDLNRFRREQRDETLKIKNFATIASNFVFSDTEEKSLFAQSNAMLRRSLPQMYDNDAWLAMVLLELQARAERIASIRFFFSNHGWGTEFDPVGPRGSDPLVGWLLLQYWDIRKSFQFTADPSRYPWYGVFSGLEVVPKQHLSSRELAVALAAPLPALLNFINRISWGEARLEIVSLHLEPGAALARAWLICRGNYLVRKPPGWYAVKEASETVGDNLLVDPDSSLLWQKVNRKMGGKVFKKEL